MNFQICIAMISLLKNLIGADTGFFYNFKTIHIERCGIDINPSYLSVKMFNTVYMAYGIGNKFCIVFGMLSKNKD